MGLTSAKLASPKDALISKRRRVSHVMTEFISSHASFGANYDWMSHYGKPTAMGSTRVESMQRVCMMVPCEPT